MLTAYACIEGGKSYRINWWDGDKKTIMALAKKYILEFSKNNMAPGTVVTSTYDGEHLRFTHPTGEHVELLIAEGF